MYTTAELEGVGPSSKELGRAPRSWGGSRVYVVFVCFFVCACIFVCVSVYVCVCVSVYVCVCVCVCRERQRLDVESSSDCESIMPYSRCAVTKGNNVCLSAKERQWIHLS